MVLIVWRDILTDENGVVDVTGYRLHHLDAGSTSTAFNTEMITVYVGY